MVEDNEKMGQKDSALMRKKMKEFEESWTPYDELSQTYKAKLLKK